MTKGKTIFTLSCCSHIEGNKGNGGYLSLEARNKTEALRKGQPIIESAMAKEGHDKKKLTTTAFKPENQGEARKKLNQFVYNDGDPRL